ncbi:hypothetical protein [Ruegeria profundi]|uniref:Uncharacterized protein n=1 Tax=Ruegeria profundi TaxID=1685378 RepID=A0A0X3TQ10_9RHOB|nr:hypothetical protein [Ruegeria profundi]KUJ77769.1 hypothetical protein AVO44_15680 [Ruegeria profundi]
MVEFASITLSTITAVTAAAFVRYIIKNSGKDREIDPIAAQKFVDNAPYHLLHNVLSKSSSAAGSEPSSQPASEPAAASSTQG